jgi:DNA-binding LacI/PurR family transcriptional regulator
MGKVAARKMFQIITEETLEHRATTLQPELIERDSTSQLH